MTEGDLQRAIMLAVSNGACRLFRNSVGEVQDPRSGRYIRYGLCVGSSDLIGWRTVTVTPDMVGTELAVFVALEVKTPRGRVTPEQATFVQAVTDAGGIGRIVRSVEDAKIFLTTA